MIEACKPMRIGELIEHLVRHFQTVGDIPVYLNIDMLEAMASVVSTGVAKLDTGAMVCVLSNKDLTKEVKTSQGNH